SPGSPPSLKLRRALNAWPRRSLLTAEVRLRTKAVGVDGTGRSVSQRRRCFTEKLRRTGCPACAGHDEEDDTRLRSRDTTCPSFSIRRPSSELRGRREGRVSADTHGPRAAKKHAAEPQVQPEQPAFPARVVLRLIRDLPGDRALLPPSL